MRRSLGIHTTMGQADTRAGMLFDRALIVLIMCSVASDLPPTVSANGR
ncbi:MAG: hypothetical protein ACM3X0_11305 [Bacteroidota bacterium]